MGSWATIMPDLDDQNIDVNGLTCLLILSSYKKRTPIFDRKKRGKKGGEKKDTHKFDCH